MEAFNIYIYLWGVFGSAAIEVVEIVNALSKGSTPAYYKDFEYWIVRLVIAIVAGFFPIMYGVKEPIVAIHLGISTPFLMESFLSKKENRTNLNKKRK